MSKDEKKSRGGGSGAAIAAILIGLLLVSPILYFLSIGPVIWYVNTMGGPPPEWAVTVYFPLEWLNENCEPVRPAMDWYIDLWQ